MWPIGMRMYWSVRYAKSKQSNLCGICVHCVFTLQAQKCCEDTHLFGDLTCTRICAELKCARSLVRSTEINATLQEQKWVHCNLLSFPFTLLSSHSFHSFSESCICDTKSAALRSRRLRTRSCLTILRIRSNLGCACIASCLSGSKRAHSGAADDDDNNAQLPMPMPVRRRRGGPPHRRIDDNDLLRDINYRWGHTDTDRRSAEGTRQWATPMITRASFFALFVGGGQCAGSVIVLASLLVAEAKDAATIDRWAGNNKKNNGGQLQQQTTTTTITTTATTTITITRATTENTCWWW